MGRCGQAAAGLCAELCEQTSDIANADSITDSISIVWRNRWQHRLPPTRRSFASNTFATKNAMNFSSSRRPFITDHRAIILPDSSRDIPRTP
jgi:hypothetical protein